MKADFFKKFLSRKFIVCAVGIIVGIAVLIGADSSEITKVAGAVVSAVSAVSYIYGEAKVDAASAGATVQYFEAAEKAEENEEEIPNDFIGTSDASFD